MPALLRNTVAVVAGVAVAFVLVAAIEALGHAADPVAAVIDFDNPAQMRSYMESLPFGTYLFVLASWVVATFCGGVVSSLVAGTRPVLFSAMVGAVVLAATVANLLMLPHPVWVSVAGVAGVVAAAVAAGKAMSALARRRG